MNNEEATPRARWEHILRPNVNCGTASLWHNSLNELVGIAIDTVSLHLLLARKWSRIMRVRNASHSTCSCVQRAQHNLRHRPNCLVHPNSSRCRLRMTCHSTRISLRLACRWIQSKSARCRVFWPQMRWMPVLARHRCSPGQTTFPGKRSVPCPSSGGKTCWICSKKCH